MPILAPSILAGGSVALLGAASSVDSAPVVGEFPSGGEAYPVASGGASPFGSCQNHPATPGAVLAALTDGGRNLLARMLVEGLAFRVTGFRVGTGGYNPSAPTSPKPLDTSLTELEGDTFPVLSASPEAIDRYEYANAQAAAFLCRVAAAEAVQAIGEWGIYVTITASPVDPTEVGDVHLFALCNRPLVGKTLADVLVWRLVVQY